MATQSPTYITKGLSVKTWPDFERLFSQGNGWDFCACMHFHRSRWAPESRRLDSRAERGVRNRHEKKALVERGRSHGILVYASSEPVGWCQDGRREDFPRIDESLHYRGLAPNGRKTLWRITCFVVDKRRRRHGVGAAALRAALDAIRSRGGGLVEAYPLSGWKAGTFGNVSTHGTMSMFEKEGFKVVAPFRHTKFSTNVLMRRTVRPRPRRQP